MGISKARKLTESQVHELLKRCRETQDPSCKESVVRHYSNLVESIARKYAATPEHVEDLTQEGYIGLIKSIDTFDERKGVKFATYASHFVVGHIKHYLRDKARIIKEPAWLQELAQKIDKSARSVRSALGREPTIDEIADDLELDPQVVRAHFATREVFRVSSLSDKGDDPDNKAELGDRVADRAPDLLELPIEEKVVLHDALDQLKEIEQHVLARFFFDGMSQTDISQALGISCNYVSHLLRSGIDKLRQILATQAAVEDQKRIAELNKRLQSYEAAAMAYTPVDVQSGLYNRKYFEERIQEEISRAIRYGGNLSVILFEVTATSGDGSLDDDSVKRAAVAIKGNVRKVDIPARVDKGIFGLILPQTGASADLVRERIRSLLCDLRLKRGKRVSVSCGASSFPNDGKTTQDLIAAAGERLRHPEELARAA
jgi:RNA polymerase sigma-B factor